MKKLAILGASVALAAVPVVGVFAADTTTVTDEVQVTISDSCTLGITEGAKPTKTLANGTADKTLAGAQFSITCNNGKGWTLKAQGDGTGDDKTTMVDAANHTIPTGTSLDGSASNWAFKAAGTGVLGGYTDFAQVPTEATAIAESATPTSAQSVNITYGVSVDATQAAGTYTGKVTYTLVNPKEDA